MALLAAAGQPDPPTSVPRPDKDLAAGRLGGARADFVAMLGRRVAELTSTLKSFREDPSSTRLRDELRRRIHALSAGARLLRFAKLAEELVRCEELLAKVVEAGSLGAEDADALQAMFNRMPQLAWGHSSIGPEGIPPPAPTLPGLGTSPSGAPEPGSGAETPSRALPSTALVVGPAPMADALSGEIGGDASLRGDAGFEVERTEHAGTALDLARALAPDLVVVDADVTGAKDLVAALLADPMTEPVPVIVLGRWSRPEDAASFVALGVARALPKPVPPHALRRACTEALATYVRREIVREPLGELTLDELGARLAEELRRGLCDAVDAKGRATRVALGEGTDVLAALWGAVARIRDLVTIHSGGNVRFSASGPEGALPIAAWAGANDGTTRSHAPTAARAADPGTLDGMSVLVADDDPAVTWFLAGVLRAAGAEVHEAHDGARALEVAFRHAPDLVISDVVMPGLDGFGLCRALKRDVILRDVPVILLSWKEDLLQRVRELGADADGYLRKESSAAAIVQRVREVMRPRRRVADRLAAGGEVRGRLDGLTTRTLLGLACAHRPTATVTVRDASFLYEVEIHHGRPASATRTAPDGTFQRGPTVIAALLGVGAGRFVVSASPKGDAAVRARHDLVGRLSDQLHPAVASARAAQRLLSGERLVQVERVVIADDRIAAYLDATPEPARSLVRAIAQGASPRALVTSGQTSARLLEDVLCDAAAHGTVTSVFGAGGVDLMPAAVERELAVLAGVRLSLVPASPEDPLSDITTLPPVPTPPPLAELIAASSAATIPPAEVEAEGMWPFRRSLVGLEPPTFSTGPLTPTPTPTSGERAITSFLEAVESSPSPGPATGSAAEHLEESSASVARSAQDAAGTTHGGAEVLDDPARASVDAASELDLSTTPPPARAVRVEVSTAAAPKVVLPPLKVPPLTTLGSLTPPPVQSLKAATPAPKPAKKPSATPPPERVAQAPRTARQDDDRPLPRPSAYAPAARPEPASDRRGRMLWVTFAVASCAFAVAMRWTRQTPPPAPPAPELPAAAPVSEAPAAEAPAPESATATTTAGATAEASSAPAQELPLRPEDKVGPGEGMLEVVAGASDQIYVDGRLVGPGPIAKIALAPRDAPYEVRVKLRGEERVRFVGMKEGRLMRVRVAPPWSR